MQFISLKWKLSLALVVLSMSLVGLYVFVAKQVFESDKIAYIFESQQAQLESLSKVIQQKVERILFDSRSILFSYDFESKSLGASARAFFTSQNSIRAIQAINSATSEVIALLEKEPGAGAGTAFGSGPTNIEPLQRLSLAAHGPSLFLIASPSEVGSRDHLILRVVAEIPDLLPQVSGSRTVILAKADQILASSKGAEAFQELLEDLSRDRATGMTGIRALNGKRYLVFRFASGDFRPQSHAHRAGVHRPKRHWDTLSTILGIHRVFRVHDRRSLAGTFTRPYPQT